MCVCVRVCVLRKSASKEYIRLSEVDEQAVGRALVGRVKAMNCDLCSYITASSNDAS